MDIESFADAFDERIGAMQLSCPCGKTYYDAANSYDWGDGELESLEKDEEAIPLDGSVSAVSFEGMMYVQDCKCWHPRAEKIMAFLDNHHFAIAQYFKNEKARITKLATEFPEIS